MFHKCGVNIHSQITWLCASSDGLVFEQGKLKKVLEVKCLISCQNKPIFGSINNKPNVSYLKYENNQFFLKTTLIFCFQ